MRKSVWVAAGIISIILIIATFVAISYREQTTATAFFGFTLMDIVNALITVIIGFYITYIISVSFQNQVKKNEIVLDALAMIQQDTSALMQYIDALNENEITQATMNRILLFFRITRNDLNIAISLCKKDSQMSNELNTMQQYILEFNTVATCDQFFIGNKLDAVYHQNCVEKYYNLKRHLFQCKAKVFS